MAHTIQPITVTITSDTFYVQETNTVTSTQGTYIREWLCSSLKESSVFEGLLVLAKMANGFFADDYLLHREAKVGEGSCTEEVANAQAKVSI